MDLTLFFIQIFRFLPVLWISQPPAYVQIYTQIQAAHKVRARQRPREAVRLASLYEYTAYEPALSTYSPPSFISPNCETYALPIP